METLLIKKPTRQEKIAAGTPKPLLGMQRKKARADERKELLKGQYYAYLRNFPTSPRKMRLVADLIRNQTVERALAILKLHPRHASVPLRRLLLTAIDSFETKSGQRADQVGLFVQTITVDGGASLKRLRTAPQGRAHRVRKRSNHIYLRLNVRTAEAEQAPAAIATVEAVAPPTRKPAKTKSTATAPAKASSRTKKSNA